MAICWLLFLLFFLKSMCFVSILFIPPLLHVCLVDQQCQSAEGTYTYSITVQIIQYNAVTKDNSWSINYNTSIFWVVIAYLSVCDACVVCAESWHYVSHARGILPPSSTCHILSSVVWPGLLLCFVCVCCSLWSCTSPQSCVTGLLLCSCCPAHVVQWSNHLGAMCSRAWRSQWPRIDSNLSPGASAY